MKITKKKAGIIIGIVTAVVLVTALILVLTPIISLKLQLNRMIQGCSFVADYEVTFDDSDIAFYKMLQELELGKGTIEGELAGKQAHMEIISEVGATPATEIYKSDQDIFVNVGMLYTGYSNKVKKEHPLIGLVIPAWSMSDYISFAQMQEIMGTDYSKAVMADISLQDLEKVTPENGMEGYRYYELPATEAGEEIILGIKKQFLYGDEIKLQLQIQNPRQGSHIKMNVVAVGEAETEIHFSGQKMTDEEIGNLKSLWKVLQGIIGQI